jgi:hypothetical protein
LNITETAVIYSSLNEFRAKSAGGLGKGPFAIVIAEDPVELGSTLRHVCRSGFKRVFLLVPAEIQMPAGLEEYADRIDIIRHLTRQSSTACQAVNTVINLAPGEWIHYCFNGEYLFFPFCEDRSIGEALAFVVEERRFSVLTYVIDLYAADLTQNPNAVSSETAHLDSSGYYAETRKNADGDVLDRQLNFFGGLRWRFEEHVPPQKRKIDRVGLFQAQPGLRLREDHTMNDEEFNTYACPWHNSMTAAICSFRVAKALRTNPGSRHDIENFCWHNSARFDWSSQQLMELGLIEPGQWF